MSKRFVIMALAVLWSAAAYAQIGTGWTRYTPSVKTQNRGCGTNSGMTFRLTCSTASGDQRSELRYGDISGTNQFEGTVVVNSMPGDKISLKQVHPLTGGWVMIALRKPGTLYTVNGGTALASYTIGTSVRINTITNVGARTCQIYINGSLKKTQTGGVPPLYDKLGVYRTGSGHGPISATWSNISFWRK